MTYKSIVCLHYLVCNTFCSLGSDETQSNLILCKEVSRDIITKEFPLILFISIFPLRYHTRTILWRAIIIWGIFIQLWIPFLELLRHVFKASLEGSIDKNAIKVPSLVSMVQFRQSILETHFNVLFLLRTSSSESTFQRFHGWRSYENVDWFK